MYKLFKNKTKHHNFCYAFLVFSSVLFAVKTYLIERNYKSFYISFGLRFLSFCYWNSKSFPVILNPLSLLCQIIHKNMGSSTSELVGLDHFKTVQSSLLQHDISCFLIKLVLETRQVKLLVVSKYLFFFRNIPG